MESFNPNATLTGNATLNMKNFLSKTLVLTAVLGSMNLAACTSLGRKNVNASEPVSGEGSTNTSSSSDVATQVVGQVAQNDAVFSRHDRDYWLGIRSNAKGPLTKARAALATGEADAAANLARSYLAKNPGNTDALIVLAGALAMSRKYELAAYYAGLVDKAQPGHPVALNIKGLATMLSPNSRATDLRLASEYFKASFSANDAQIAAGLNLGYLQLEQGDAAAALDTFKEVERRCQECMPSLMGVGVAANRVGKYDLARDSFQTVLDKKPNNGAALYHLALVYKKGYNDKKQAEKTLSKLLANQASGDAYMREKAQTVLREIKGQADIEQRTAIADSAESNSKSSVGNATDADLMMSAAEAEDSE
jgi:tetratricopeptide (TPR) repeat protein